MMFEPITAKDESVWTDEYAKLVISSYTRRPLPPPIQKIGNTSVIWQEPIPGYYHVHAAGGTVDDRILARAIVGEQVEAYGLKRIQFTVGGSELRKTADWDEVQQKAIRLMNSGNVQILRNSPTAVVGHVIGDHGEYQTELSRQDPDSNVLDHWVCDCPWSQFAWQRTRKWKSLEGRPCAHVLATHWYAQGTPMDQEFDPTTGQPIAPEGPGGQMGMPIEAPGIKPPTEAPMPGAPNIPSQQLSIPGIDPGMATATPPAPPGPAIIPPMPAAPVPPPVSVPGAKVPDAMNPMQWPEGTFSKIATKPQLGDPYDYGVGGYGKGMEYEDGQVREWHTENWVTEGGAPHHDDMNDEAPHAYPVRYWIIHPDGREEQTWPLERKDKDDDWYFGAAGDTFSRVATESTFQNSDIVRLEVEEYGVAQGRSEDHGAGQWKKIPKNSLGEVLGTDPTTGWVNCLFTGPCKNNGPMEPHGVTAWIEPQNLSASNTPKPGPAVRRR